MAEEVKEIPSNKPVTMIVRRTVKPGREADYEQWVKDATEDMKKFPGYMDTTMMKPNQGGNKGKEYVLIIRFDTYEHVNNWESSDVRNAWIEKAKEFTESVTNTKITGLEYWFPLPEIPKAAVPPRQKMIAVTILGIYPLSIVVGMIFNAIPFIATLNPYIKGLLTAIVMVTCMTYFVMPFLTSRLRFWLFPKK